MDVTNGGGASGGGSWDLDMNMGNQLLLDQFPLDLVPARPRDHVHARQLPSSSGFVHAGKKDGRGGGGGDGEEEEAEEEEEKLGPMKEMMYRIASMQPVDIDPATIKKPRRRNVRISDDPQSTAARHRRERISERIRILQRLVPGGTKLDTASMLDEAVRYVKYLKRQVQILQSDQISSPPPAAAGGGHPAAASADWPTVAAEALRAPAAAPSPSTTGIIGAALGFTFKKDGRCGNMH